MFSHLFFFEIFSGARRSCGIFFFLEETFYSYYYSCFFFYSVICFLHRGFGDGVVGDGRMDMRRVRRERIESDYEFVRLGK